MAVGLLVNLDVPDLDAATRFYTTAFALVPGRRLGTDMVELLGAPAPLYLIRKGAGSVAAGPDRRRYGRHWCPLHLDWLVDDLDLAVECATAAGAAVEDGPVDLPYGRQATLADPFGHGFCLIQMNEDGYDALAQ